jgi:hypothetical protein
MVLIDPEGVLAEPGGPRTYAWVGADLETISSELQQHGMHTEPAAEPGMAEVAGLSRYALAALAALPTVRLLVAVAGSDASVHGYLAVLADDDPRAVERDQRLISALTG